MKPIYLFTYLILILNTVGINFLPIDQNENLKAIALSITSYYASCIMYFITITSENNTRLMLNPKHFYAFANSYKDYVVNSYLICFLKKKEIIPLLLTPLVVSFSHFPLYLKFGIIASEYCIGFYSIFIFVILYQLLTSNNFKLNFNLLLIYTFAIPAFLIITTNNLLTVILNPLGPFLSSWLLLTSGYFISTLIFQLFFLVIVLIFISNTVLKKWPI